MGACPSDDVLAVFVERRTDTTGSVEGHLDGCAHCRVLVAHLAAVGAEQRAKAGYLDPSASTGRSIGAPPTLVSNVNAASPTRIARYVVERELGRGGMGIVLLAHDPDLDRKVAVKVVRGHAGDDTARARLLREARAMARLSHPNVVAIHDVGTLGDGEVFLAMEVVHGPTLREALAARDRSVAEVIDLFVQAGHGLAAAHAVGLVHRDFKPANVLVGADGRVRVTDFGLARGDAEAVSSALTGHGMVVGTPAYMAPEQHCGMPATERADQYAFCVALFEALTGQRPHVGKSFEEMTAAKLNDERRPWPPVPVIAPEIRAAIERGLTPDPALRHASMGALLMILERAPRAKGPAPKTAVAPPTAAPPTVAPATVTSPTAAAPATAAGPAPEPASPVQTVPLAAPLARAGAATPAPPRQAYGPPPQPLPRARVHAGSRAPLFLGVAAIAIAGLFAAGLFLLRGGGRALIATPPTTGRLALTPEEELRPAAPPPFRALAQTLAAASTMACPAGAAPRTSGRSVTCTKPDGIAEGPALKFYPNGRLAEQATYHLGAQDGRTFILREDDGTLLEIGTFVGGKREGATLQLDRSGAIKSEAHYKNGKQHGIARLWEDGGGPLIQWQRYEDDRLVETRE